MIALNETLLPEKEKTSSISMDNYKLESPYFGKTSNVLKFVLCIPSLSSSAKKFISKLQSFKEYAENWDSYGAKKPSEIAINNAITLIKQLDENNLPIYFTAPGPNGEIIVELKKNKIEIEVYFNPNGSNHIYLYENNNCLYDKKDEEDTIGKNWEKIMGIM
jgi:hypothetical protein